MSPGQTFDSVRKAGATTRPAAVAGSFYPAPPSYLRAAVERYLADASPPPKEGMVRAVITPHAGYVYSGPIAGHSFRALPALAGRTIYLFGPAHFVPLHGLAAGSFSAMATPLGPAQVATDIMARLLAAGDLVHEDEEAHAPEHCLEVELPFLQVLGGANFRVAPLLFGQVNPVRAADLLAEFLAQDRSALIVVSSDLSHYHPYDVARKMDMAFLEAVVRGNVTAAERGEACGLLPILTLMLLAERFGWQPRLLDYRNSGDTAGDRRRVVGYGAVAYVDTVPHSPGR